MPEANAIQAGPARRGAFAGLWDFLRWFAFIVLVSGILAGMGFFCVQSRLDDEIRRYVENKFRSHYTNLHVTVESARRIPGVGIEIRGIRISEPDAAGQGVSTDSLAYVDEMLVRCSTELGDLVGGQADCRQVIVRRPHIKARRERDGRWNTLNLVPLPRFGSGSPDVTIENATVEVQSRREAASSLRLDNINMTIVPVLDESGGQLPESAAGARRFQGQLRGNLFSSAELEGQFDLNSHCWTAQGTVQGLETSAESLAYLPEDMASRLGPLASYRGQTQLSFRCQSAEAGAAQTRFACSGTSRGRIEDARLPQPLTDVEVSFSTSNDELHVERAHAQAGETRIEVSGQWNGMRSGGPLQFRAVAQRLMLSNALAGSLPANWRDGWQQLSPRGVVNATADISFDGRQWAQDVTIDCVDVSMTYARFPYPVDKIRGRVRYHNGSLELQDLWASVNGRPLRLQGAFSAASQGGAGWLEFLVRDPVPLDEQLMASLQGPAQSVVRSLEPHGFVSVWGRYERTANDPAGFHKRLEIGLTDCSINYEKFRYPLYRIRGTLSMTDDRWTFRDLEGYNDSGWVTCSGRWEPVAAGGTELALDFHAMDVPLEDELKNALKPQAQQIWNNLCPRGSIDDLKVAVRYASRAEDLAVDVLAVKRPPDQNVEGRSISVKPTWFPYPWDDVAGSVHFNNGVVELKEIRAVHGDTELEFSGRIDTSPEGPWQLQMSPLNIDRFDASREFVMALPPRLGHALSRLNVSGLISLSGSMAVSGNSRNPAPPAAAWKLNIDLEDGGIDCGARFEHVRGGLLSEGEFNGNAAVGTAELNLDSLMCKGVQLTRISGPVQMEDSLLRFGERIPEPRRRGTPRPVTANAWGGTLSGSGEVQLGEPSLFDLQIGLAEGDLAAISEEATDRKRHVSGRTFANVRLNGSSAGVHTLRGVGRVLLREADLYELPVMVAMLKLLTIKSPDLTAFTSSDVDFRIEADRIYFDRIDFDGDAISLDGRGEMSLDRQIHLTFGTTVGRDDYYAALLRPILKEAGRRLMVIEVVGTLDNPELRREFVPELSERFQQLFPSSGREGPQTAGLPVPFTTR